MLLFALAVAQVAADPSKAEIPAIFRGRWSTMASLCRANDHDVVTVGSRQIDFYEESAFIDLLALNDATSPPSVHATVRWLGELRFRQGAIRLEIDGGKLYITARPYDEPHVARNAFEALVRCPG